MNSSRNIDWQTIEPDYAPEYVAGLRRLSGAQKLAQASALYHTALSVKMAGLRRWHPEWGDIRLRREAARAIMLSSASA